MPSSNCGDDFVGIGDALEGFRARVVIVEEAIDRGLEVGDRSEDAAFKAAFGEGDEEALDRGEPGRRCRREVECPARVAGEPPAHGGMLVGGVVVKDRVNSLADGDFPFDDVQERMNSWW
jgi:hypothetical protein